MEATECGAAALAIVLEHHGSYVPLSQLRQECGVSRDGSKASNVLKAARNYGLQARGFRKEPEDLRSLPLPAIVHWNFNHFVVLEGFGKNKAYLNDPASGPRSVTEQELDRAFTGVVLTFEPTDGFVPLGRRPALLPSLLSRLSGSRGGLAFVALAGLGLVLPGLAIPVFSKVFVDDVLVGQKYDWLPALLLGMALTAGLRGMLAALQRAYLVKLLMKLAVSMSSSFLWHLLRLPVRFFLARTEGDLSLRVQQNDQVANLLSGRLSQVALDLILVAFYGVMMLYFDPLLSLLGFGTAALHALLLRLAQRGRTDLGRRVAQEESKLAGVAAGGLQMIETIKATGAESDFFAQWAGHQAKHVAAQQHMARREQLMLIFVSGLSRISALLVLGLGALRVMDGAMSVGTLVAFQSLMTSFLSPIERLGEFGIALQQLRGGIERLDDVLGHGVDAAFASGAAGQGSAASPPGLDDEAADSPPAQRLTGELELRDITFGYLPFSPPLIDRLDLKLAPGQRVALVGGTGSGKSTIARVVTGLYEPWAGEILFDGQPRNSLPRSALNSSVAMVDQDIALFEGSVRDNLTLWDDTIPEVDVVQAAKDACIHEDITRLPGGYDAHVTEGGFNFSGGQRQRLEIARALLRQPAMVVLDEATSALDPDTEQRVDENLRRRGCSCLIVAHRLSTIRDCDEILVLDKGSVVQRGSHEQLLTDGGLYKELITAS